jgi:PAS domain S-box-containing protein
MRLSTCSDDDAMTRPTMASRHTTPMGPESPGLSPKDVADGGVGTVPHRQSPARFGLGSAQRKRDNSRFGMASAMSVDGGVVESVASADDDAQSGRSGSAVSDDSAGSASTGTSGMIVNSFGLIDRHVRKVGGVSQLTGLDDLLQDPTAERLSVFRTRFDALFVILDAAVRLTLHPFIVMTPDCTVILASPSINALLGFTAEELTGNNINMVMPHSVGHNHDEVVARYVDSIAAGVSERASSVVYNTRPVTARAKDGSPVNVELTVRPILSDDSVADVAAAMGGAAGTSGAPGCPVAGTAGRAGRKREVVLFVAQLRDARAEISLRNIVKESSTLVSLFPFPYIEADEMMTILKVRRVFGGGLGCGDSWVGSCVGVVGGYCALLFFFFFFWGGGFLIK